MPVMTGPEEALRTLPAPGDGGAYRVAFSGGLDSTVLLHALIAQARAAPVSAIHVDHGMQGEADRWARHCRDRCRQLGVPLATVEVRVPGGHEAAAREARYAALRARMAPGDVLLTAQHADDQAETFLLQVLRGAGPRGLAGMPASAAFGPGTLARPFLDLPRAAIERYACLHGLDWIEDPSNRDAAVARSAIRHRALPALRSVRADAAAALGRSAGAAAEAAALANEIAAEDLAACAGPLAASLDLGRLGGLSAPRRRNLLRHWPPTLGLPAPTEKAMATLERALLPARADASPRVAWGGAELRRYRRWLFLMSPLPAAPDPGTDAGSWEAPGALPLPPGCGWLAGVAVTGAGLRAAAGPFRVRFRRGGERLRLAGRAHDTALKGWLQDAGLPPWVRARLPLIMTGERVAAVADCLVCEGFAAAPGQPGWRPRWVAPPPGAALPRVVGGGQFG